jgi:hypothetical protein
MHLLISLEIRNNISETTHQQSYIIDQQSYIIDQQSYIIDQQSYIIDQQSYIIDQQSYISLYIILPIPLFLLLKIYKG